MGELVENCYFITPKDVGSNFEQIQKNESSKLEGRNGINYWFDNISQQDWLFVSVDGHEPQKLKWEVVEITYGQKQFFFCECGRRCMKLYLLPGGDEFKCRECHNLRYALTTFNKNSPAGHKIYQMNRIQKLSEGRANMARIFYNGKFSKRFARFIRLCDRAGLQSIVQGANDLKTLIGE